MNDVLTAAPAQVKVNAMVTIVYPSCLPLLQELHQLFVAPIALVSGTWPDDFETIPEIVKYLFTHH